jgi:hypothetical protein
VVEVVEIEIAMELVVVSWLLLLLVEMEVLDKMVNMVRVLTDRPEKSI